MIMTRNQISMTLQLIQKKYVTERPKQIKYLNIIFLMRGLNLNVVACGIITIML